MTRLPPGYTMHDHGPLVEILHAGTPYATASKIVGGKGWIVEIVGNPYPQKAATKRGAVRDLKAWVAERVSQPGQ